MKWLALALILSASKAMAADVPFYLRDLSSQKDVSGLNENFRSLVGDITKLRTDIDAVPVATTSTGTPKYMALWVSSSTASSDFSINLASPAASGTITYMSGSSFPATARVIYHSSLIGSTEPGSHAGASNPAISVTPSAQGFLANTTVIVNVGNNAATGYTATGMILFIGYDP